MKSIIFVCVIFCLNNIQLFSQKVYIVENILTTTELPRRGRDYEQYFVMINNKDTIKVKTHGYDYMWNPVDDLNIACCNITNISILNLRNEKFSLIYECSKNEIIAEFMSSKNYCYFITQKANELNCSECKVKVLNINTGEINVIPLSDTLNYNGISVSPNESKFAFIYTRHIESEKEQYYLLAYDFHEKTIQVLDSAMYNHKERFIRDSKNKALSWINDDELAYYKKEGSANRIYSFQFKRNEKKCLYELPMGLNSICLKGYKLYYVDENAIRNFNSNTLLYRTKIKYDFLGQRLFVK